MNEKNFNSKFTYPNNIRGMIEDKLLMSKYYLIPGQEKLTDDKLTKLIDFLTPHLNTTNQSIMQRIKNNNMTLEVIGQEEGITKERVRQILNLVTWNMTSDENALFFLLPSSEAHRQISIIKQNYKNKPICSIRKFTKKEFKIFSSKNIITFEQLYDNSESLINQAENKSQKKRLKDFISDYENQMSKFDLWNTY